MDKRKIEKDRTGEIILFFEQTMEIKKDMNSKVIKSLLYSSLSLLLFHIYIKHLNIEVSIDVLKRIDNYSL